MSYSFEEIMAYHPDNKDVYEEIKKNLSVMVPFVGAGLTQFAYCSWGKALDELAGKITDKKNCNQVKKLIKSGDYLDAAQRLEDLRTKTNLARDLVHLFSKERLMEKQSVLYKQAIYLLPKLFSGLVLTTNFDETLEYVYQECGLPLIESHPGHSELLEQLLRGDRNRGLFKFHGTIKGDYIEYDNIVFTKQQYERHYKKDSALVRDLENCIKKKIILFLGCSLGKDLTMDVLQGAMQQGDYYYAILSCKKRERDAKITELGKKQIRVILYEDGRHEAVRVILEHLLEEIDPNTYKMLSYHEGALSNEDLAQRFSYDADIVPFVGRDQEQKELKGFLGDSKIPFRWWAITGPGGAGKSRLAFEFKKQICAEWDVHYLVPEEYGKLFELSDRLTRKTLIIADYVQEHAQELGMWMEGLNERAHSLPLRVLLVEREGRKEAESANEKGQLYLDTAWEKQLYNRVRHEQKLRKVCFKEGFLNLLPLSDLHLKEIIQNYASALKGGHKALSDKTIDILYQKLKEIDPDLCRPLYAMFLTDVFLDGKEPEHWNQKDVLDYVLEREEKRLDFRIAHVTGAIKGDKKLLATCRLLLCLATVFQNIKIKDLRELCPEEWEIIETKAENFETPEALLEQIGIAVLEPGKDRVLALRPDLIGEYFVYQWLIQQKKETVEYFFRVAWQPLPWIIVFYDRMFRDYGYLINTTPEHWEVMLPDVSLILEENIYFYSAILSDAAYYCNSLCQCQRIVSLLETVASKYPQILETVDWLADGLFYLSCKQEESGVQETIGKLEKLAEKNPENLEITVEFSKGLFNLSCEQKESGAQETIGKLEKLAEKNPENPEIAVVLAKGLANLTSKQKESGAQETIGKLEKLAEKNPENPEIAITLAKGLVNLTGKQKEDGVQETIGKLEKLAEKNPEITIELAKGLVNLSYVQEESRMQETIGKLEKLVEKNPENLEILEILNMLKS